MSAPNTWTYDLHGKMESSKTAEFDGIDGSGNLLSPFYVGPANYAVQTNETQKTIGQKAVQQLLSDLPGEITKQMEAQGYTPLGVTITNVSYAWRKQKGGVWWAFPIVRYDLAKCSLTLEWTARVTLSAPLSKSPFPAWVFTLIKLVGEILLAALIAYWIIQAVKDVFTSMTTTEETITEYNPDGTIKKETKKKGPDIAGILTVGAVIIVSGIVAYVIMSGKKKKNGNANGNAGRRWRRRALKRS